MFGLPSTTLEALKQVFSSYLEIDQVIIYGSRARGNFRPGSDIDLTLKGKI
jgi:predicted nucleotidyltransferase